MKIKDFRSGRFGILLVLFAILGIFFFSVLKFSKSTNHFIAEYFFLEKHHNQTSLFVLNFLSEKERDYYTYYLLGRIYFVENDLYQSLEAYTISIDLNPNHKESYYGRGLSYGFMGNNYYSLAEKDFVTYLELVDEEYSKFGKVTYGAWAGYNDLAWIYYLMNDFQRQKETSLKGLKITENNPWLLNNLGVSLVELGDCREANKYFSLAKKYLEPITVEQFGEAYSGDSEDFWVKGLGEMHTIIGENQSKCEK